jgi:hypothetical protein
MWTERGASKLLDAPRGLMGGTQKCSKFTIKSGDSNEPKIVQQPDPWGPWAPVVGPWGSPVMVIPKGPAVLHCIWWCQDLQSGAAVRSFLLRIRLPRCGTTGPFQRDCHRSKWHLWVNHHHNLYIPNETIDRCNFGVPSSDRPVWLSSIGMTRGFDRPLGSWPITVVLSFRTKSMSILDCELPHKNQILLK